MKKAAQHKPLPPTTTVEEDTVTAGQRAVNLLWERTQAFIARFVVVFTIMIDGAIAIIHLLTPRDLSTGQTATVGFLNMICGIVISFYFSRTNHTQIGGVGIKATDTQKYVGR